MDNRTRLLDCALALFAARGYDAVGVQEIVEAAGVTKPTLYHYFNNKRGLLEALLAERFAEFIQDLQRAAVYQNDMVGTLQKVARVYFTFAQNQPVFYRLQLGMQYASPDSEPYQAMTGFSREQFRIMETLFEQAAEEHGNMRGRQRAFAASFIGMLNTYIGMFLYREATLDEALIYQALRQYMYGIFT